MRYVAMAAQYICTLIYTTYSSRYSSMYTVTVQVLAAVQLLGCLSTYLPRYLGMYVVYTYDRFTVLLIPVPIRFSMLRDCRAPSTPWMPPPSPIHFQLFPMSIHLGIIDVRGPLLSIPPLQPPTNHNHHNHQGHHHHCHHYHHRRSVRYSMYCQYSQYSTYTHIHTKESTGPGNFVCHLLLYRIYRQTRQRD